MTEPCEDGYCARARAVEAVEEVLAPLADADQALAMSAASGHRCEFLGIPVKTRQRATRGILDRRPLDPDFVRGLWSLPEREFKYVACDHLLRQRRFPAALLPVLEELITTEPWWDTVDQLARVAARCLRYDPAAAETINDWATAGDIWLRRAASLCGSGQELHRGH